MLRLRRLHLPQPTQLALGHGETLASGAVRGTPWRMSVDRATRESKLEAVSSFGAALVPDERRGDGSLRSEPVNCASHWLTVDAERRARLAETVERELGGAERVPQDIEGCITEDGRVWVVQARPQP